jgi:hypothetical protein
MLQSVNAPHERAHDLGGTPFVAMPDPPVDGPLTRGERFNVVVVLAAAQIAHLMMVAICTASIYFALGLIVLSPTILAKWTGDGTSDGTILGMTIPVPQSLIHMALILCAPSCTSARAQPVTTNTSATFSPHSSRTCTPP